MKTPINEHTRLAISELEERMAALAKNAKATHHEITKEELECAWGRYLFEECWDEATTIRRVAFERAKVIDPALQEIDFEPSADLVLAVAIRKLFAASIYHKGDFPAKIEGFDE